MGEWIEIELVEEPTRQRRVALEPTVPKPPRDPAPLEGRNRRRAGIGVGVAVVVGIVWAVSRSGGDLSTATTPSTLDEPARSSVEQRGVDTTQPAPSTTRPRATTTTGPPLVVDELGATDVAERVRDPARRAHGAEATCSTSISTPVR